MELSAGTFHHLYQLFGHGPGGLTDAHTQLLAIPRDALVCWLRGAVANPGAERHLLRLFDAACGAVTGQGRAYRCFYRELAAHLRPELKRQIIEAGEISQVTEIAGSSVVSWRDPVSGGLMPVVYKKMPPFVNRADTEEYVKHYRTYNTLLRDQVGIAVPHFDARIVERPSGQVIIYVVQQRVDPASVGHQVLRTISLRAAECLYSLVLREYEKLFRFNLAHAAEGIQLGLDGQIPNWAIAGYGGDPEALTGEEQLLYLDTNVPMIRIHGRDVVSTDMYFQALPGAARWAIKRLKLDEEVMTRYFEMRAVILDFLGNTLVRHREDLVQLFIDMSNTALKGPFAAGGFAPFALKEVRQYYRSDVTIWRFWRSMKLLGALSDGVTGGDWRVLRRVAEFYQIWAKPIF